MTLNDLPEKERGPADALIYAALSHCASANGKAMPKTMQWEGYRWWLSVRDDGRLQVSAERGFGGLLSLPALY